MQLSIALGKINIRYATVVISRYHPDTRKGHLANIQNLYYYMKKYTSTSIKLNK